MDMTVFRTISLLLMFGAFTAIAIWAFSRRPKKDFEEASRLALDEEDRREYERRSREQEEMRAGGADRDGQEKE
ncbi:MAG: cbb3-type cytochrome c oxidase subunit 3 [Gammaproteobacteria bacterium]|nr:MAG: cbb3-type cytochrome c oxidase subunit 3 [Gammaproteobacteria bacterium]